MTRQPLILFFWFIWFSAEVWFSTPVAAQSVQGARFDSAPVRETDSEPSKARPVTSMDLLTLRDPKGVSISPDGKWVALVIGQAVYDANAYRSGLFVVSTADGRVRSFGTAGLPHWDEINQWPAEDPQWSSDSKAIWYRARMRESEHWQVWTWSLVTGRRWQVTHADGDVEGCEFVSAGRALFLTVARPRATASARSYEPSILFPGQLRPYQSISVPRQMKLAEEPSREFWIHELGTDRERAATKAEVLEAGVGHLAAVENVTAEESDVLSRYHPVEAKPSPGGKSVAYLYYTDNSSESRVLGRRLLVRSKETHTVKEVTPGAYFVDQYWWKPDGSELYFTKREGRGRSHELWRASGDGSQAERVFQPPSGDYFSSFSSDASGRWFACLVENNITPPRVGLFDRTSATMRILFDLNPEFEALERSPAERIEGINKYGESWYGYLVKPLGYEPGRRYPMIITTYRSGDYFLRGASGDQNPVQVYAASGFAVLCLDVGMIRNIRPGHFEEKLMDWASPAASVESAIQQLAGRGLIDAERIGMTGFSRGEEITGYVLSHTNLVRAASGAAMHEPCFYFMAGAEWWDIFRNWGLGGWPYGQSRANWEQIAMSKNADRIRAPILENVSDTEYLVYLPVYRSLVDLGKPVELHIYPNELHVRNQPRHRFEIYERNVDWFLFWLRDEERPAPYKGDQYERWGRLRRQITRQSEGGGSESAPVEHLNE
ncbi:MAG TPA: Atxe2 family lasso peptide isopeptidase [Terriglobales bacterium]|nr:Atxe2 family lasso peptide isopeptidase [Terriglobales bacterium]